MYQPNEIEGEKSQLDYNFCPEVSSLVAQMVKNLPVMQETWVQSLSWNDSPGEGNGNPLNILGWRIPWTL